MNSNTFSFAIDRPDPVHQSILALINLHHQLRADKAPPQRLADNKRSILAALKGFHPTHRSPEWLAHVLRGEAYLSFGDIDGAIAAAEESLLHSGGDSELGSKSQNNLCEYKRQKGDYEAATKHGELACRLSKSKNLGMLITWAEALYKLGERAKAETILAAVAEVSQINEPGDVLGTHLRFEETLREMVDLPIVYKLLSQLS